MNIKDIENLLKSIKEELAKGKIAAMENKPPAYPQKPEPTPVKRVDKEAFVQQKAQDPHYRMQNVARDMREAQAKESFKARAADEAKSAKHQQSLEEYHDKIKHWPLMVMSGEMLDTSGPQGGASVTGHKYSAVRHRPEHHGVEPESFVEDAHTVESPFRVKEGKTHRLNVKLQGEGPTKKVWVTPEEYDRAMMTGWHVHNFDKE